MDFEFFSGLNVFSKHKLLTELRFIISNPQSAYTIDENKLGSILYTEACPTMRAFWQNLLKYIIIDVSFDNIPTTPIIIMRYKKEDIDISVRASTKDNIITKLFYQGTKIYLHNLDNLEKSVYLEFMVIFRQLYNLISGLVPPSILDSNVPMCSVLSTA